MPKAKWEAVRKRLNVPKKLPPAVTGDWLRQYMERNKLLGQKGVVFLDSAFAAFNALFASGKRVWENTGSDVRAALTPLAEVARETGWAIVIIHHDNKEGDTTGSGQWEGAVDYVWHYTVRGAGRQLAAKWGRWVAAKPETLVFEKPEDRLLLCGSALDCRQKESLTEESLKLAEILKHIPDLPLDEEASEGNTVTSADLQNKTGLSNAEVGRRLEVLLGRGQIRRDKLGEGNPTRLPYRYWQNSCLVPGS
jgi:hypothetical protein